MCSRVILKTGFKVVAAILLAVTVASPAFAINTPAVGGRDADNVRTNADVSVPDPWGFTDVTDFSVTPPFARPEAYGFDYKNVSLLYDQGTDALFIAVDLFGNPGDADEDGGYHSMNPGICGGAAAGAVTSESDAISPGDAHIFALGVEDVSLQFDRNCDGINDLALTVNGDSFRINFDSGAGLGIGVHAGTIGTGALGNSWTAAPIQAVANLADPNCGVKPRDGAVLFYIPNWRQYFTTNGQANGQLASGVSPGTFGLVVDSGNNSDRYSEDQVTLALNLQNPGIGIAKTADPTELCGPGATTRFTVVVTNTGDVALSNVLLSDVIPAGLVYDNAYIDDPVHPIGNPNVNGQNLTWNPFTLQPGQAVTVSFRVVSPDPCVGTLTNTATVAGEWFLFCVNEGQPQAVGPVSDDAQITCCREGNACPRTIGFWRQQCAQRDNGATKVCKAGMESLWRCVITETGVIQWKKNDGTFETTTSLRALSNSALFDALCSQLDGPRPMTLLDMAEIQYLGLMLNVCSGAIGEDVLISNAFNGTVGAAIDSIEHAINTGYNLGYWEGVADDINNRIGVEAADCPNPDSLFRNIPPCDLPDAPDFGEVSIGGLNDVATRAFPNPVQKATTSIFYSIPSDLNGARVEIAVFDLTGRLVRSLLSEVKEAGQYTVDWDLRDESGTPVSSGIFFYRVKAGSTEVTQKLMVVGR